MSGEVFPYAGPAVRVSDRSRVEVEGRFHRLAELELEDGRRGWRFRDARHAETFAGHDEELHSYLVADEDWSVYRDSFGDA